MKSSVIELTDADSISSKNTVNKCYHSTKIVSVLVSGVGFLADAYDLFVIDFVVAILAATAFNEPNSGDKSLVVSSTLAGAVVGQLFFGAAADFLGRRIMFITTAILVIFGALLSAVVGFGYSSAYQSFNVFHQLAVCRFFLGCGIGGEYPLSATVASENDTEEELIRGESSEYKKGCLWYLSHKPNSIAAVFSMQGVGTLASPLIVMLCLWLGLSLELTWRVCLGIGAIPSAIAFVFRWRMHETAAFERLQRDYIKADGSIDTSTPNSLYETQKTTLKDVELGTGGTQVSTDSKQDSEHLQIPTQQIVTHKTDKRKTHTRRDFSKHFHRAFKVIKRLRYVLLGTSMTWFLIDVTLYGTGSFKSAIVAKWFIPEVSNTPELRQLGFENDAVKRPIMFHHTFSERQLQRDLLERVLQTDHQSINENDAARNKVMLQAQMGAIVALLAIPGYILSLLFIHKVGTKRLQFWGFFAVAIVFIALGIEQSIVKTAGIPAIELILFGMTFMTSNFGPNTTTFIIPTQVYPTIIRATCHGFSAAMGKLGGVFGTSLFSVVEETWSLGVLLIACGVVALLGAAFTLFIPSDVNAHHQMLEEEFGSYREKRTKIMFDATQFSRHPLYSPAIPSQK